MNRLKKEKREIKKETEIERGRHVFNEKEYMKFEEYQKGRET